MNKQTITALAWQLRSGSLYLDGDRVKLRESALQTATQQARATVQARTKPRKGWPRACLFLGLDGDGARLYFR